MELNLDLSGSISETMGQKIELSCKDYYDRCDRKLLDIFGCFCKVAEAIEIGRIMNVEHRGKWQLMVDGEPVESFDAYKALDTFCY